MINFYRKIRKQMISENRFNKFLLYAIGEIVLVVIGILIALQFNNWNETRKIEFKFKETFLEIDKNLKKTIESADDLQKWYMRKDSLINLVMHNKVDFNDYQNTDELVSLITTESSLQIPTSGYDNLMIDIENLPKKYKPLVENLKTIYEESTQEIKSIEAFISSNMAEYIKYLTYNEMWWHKTYFTDYQITPQEYKYFTSDFYKNAVSDFSGGLMSDHRPNISFIREEAFKVRLQIANVLNITPDFLPNHTQYTHMQGKYTNHTDTISITLKNKTLYFKYKSNPESVLIPFDNARFTAYQSWFCYVNFDKQKQVIGITERIEDELVEYEKIQQ